VFIGLAQLMQGPASPLRFYPFTNLSESVGFFANRNHYAALLYSLVPFAMAWVLALYRSHLDGRKLLAALGGVALVALALGLAMSRSRAGLGLAAFAAVSGLAMLGLRRDSARSRLPDGFALLGGVLLVAVFLGIHYGFAGFASRFDHDPLADFRLTIAGVTVTAAVAFFPFGSGFGTFTAIYQMFETPDAMLVSYVNHAHNDWLELGLEGGIPALVIAGAFLVWWGRATLAAWRPFPKVQFEIDYLLPRAASISGFCLLLHSVVDYPLRTTCMSVVFAFTCALLVAPVAPRPIPGLNFGLTGFGDLLAQRRRRRLAAGFADRR
jgi:O-antigen ligase